MRNKYFIFCLVLLSISVFAQSNVAASYITKCVALSCDIGYYGDSDVYDTATSRSYSTKCLKCPGMLKADGSVQNGKTNPDTPLVKITGCYIPKDIIFSDASGEYVFTSNCNYKQ